MNTTFVKNENWWGDNEPLLGFSWKHGSLPDTKGIIFWSDVFLHEQNGEKIAIILIDTEGLFEAGRDSKLDAKVIGITSFISSIQTFNVKDVIQEDQLEHLDMIIKVAKLIMKRQNEKSLQNSSKPFQNFLFLFRDWHDEDIDFGYEGGQIYLNRFLSIKKEGKMNEKAQNVRDNIKDTYDNINAFLLPFPGKTIHKKIFDGRWSLLDEDFQEYFQILIESIFLPQNLVKKKISGREVTARELLSYAYLTFEAFQSSELPDNEFMFEHNIKIELFELSKKIFDDYIKKMTTLTDYNATNFHSKLLDDHKRTKIEVIEKFREYPKLADDETENKFIETLKNRIDEKFANYKLNVEATYNDYRERKILSEQLLLSQKAELEQQLKVLRQQQEGLLRQLGIENHKKSAAYKACKFFTFGAHHCGLKHM